MKVIISGPVTAEHLADAEMLVGIAPTSFVTNGLWSPPASALPTEVYPICPKQPKETAEIARNFTLALNADALICVGENDHLVHLANRYELVVYEVVE